MLVSRDTKGWNEEPAGGGGGRRRGRSRGRLKSLQNPKFEREISMFVSIVSLNLGWVAFDSSHALESPPPPRTSSSSFFPIAAGILCWNVLFFRSAHYWPHIRGNSENIKRQTKIVSRSGFSVFFWTALNWPLTNKLPEQQERFFCHRGTRAQVRRHTHTNTRGELLCLFSVVAL